MPLYQVTLHVQEFDEVYSVIHPTVSAPDPETAVETLKEAVLKSGYIKRIIDVYDVQETDAIPF